VAGYATHFILDALQGPPRPAANQIQAALAHDSTLAPGVAMRELQKTDAKRYGSLWVFLTPSRPPDQLSHGQKAKSGNASLPQKPNQFGPIRILVWCFGYNKML
jgi:hypothetical protein